MNKRKNFILCASYLGDRSEGDYLAETEFVRFLAENGAPVSDVIPSDQNRLVECVEADGNYHIDVEEEYSVYYKSE